MKSSPNAQPQNGDAAKTAQNETVLLPGGRQVPIIVRTATIVEGPDKGKRIPVKVLDGYFPYPSQYNQPSAPASLQPCESNVVSPQRNYDSTDVYRIVQREKYASGEQIPTEYRIFCSDHPIAKLYVEYCTIVHKNFHPVLSPDFIKQSVIALLKLLYPKTEWEAAYDTPDSVVAKNSGLIKTMKELIEQFWSLNMRYFDVTIIRDLLQRLLSDMTQYQQPEKLPALVVIDFTGDVISDLCILRRGFARVGKDDAMNRFSMTFGFLFNLLYNHPGLYEADISPIISFLPTVDKDHSDTSAVTAFLALLKTAQQKKALGPVTLSPSTDAAKILTLLHDYPDGVSAGFIREKAGFGSDSVFKKGPLTECLTNGWISRLYPDKPSHPHQKYMITSPGETARGLVRSQPDGSKPV